MFREDLTLQQWGGEYNSANVGVVYAQDGHPIEYIDTESSYKKGGNFR
jgi:hypothetical protein